MKNYLTARQTTLSIIVITLLVIIYTIWRFDSTPSTDDAYVYADTVNITPEVSGTIIDLKVKDNQFVNKGDVLFIIDPSAYQAALNKAEAALGQLEQQIFLTQHNVEAQRLNAQARTANIAAAQAAVKLAEDNLQRLQPLSKNSFVSKHDLEQAQTDKQNADARLQAALLDAQSATAAIGGIQALEAQRNVLNADIEMARINLNRTEVKAPFDGYIIGLTTTIGKYAASGQPLFTLANSNNWYVIANFRETDLKNIHPNNKVVVYLLADRKQAYDAVVDSIGYGVMPSDGSIINAVLPNVPRSINWVHVAQRFPVKIRITTGNTHDFRIGASALVIVKPEN